MAGRPTLATGELKAAIVEKVAGGEYLRTFCGENGFPSRSTVARWLQEDADFATQYAHARESSGEVHEQSVAKLVDGVITGDIEPDAARVAINALTWLAKVRAPRQYGDQLDVKHSGGVVVEVMRFSDGTGPATG